MKNTLIILTLLGIVGCRGKYEYDDRNTTRGYKFMEDTSNINWYNGHKMYGSKLQCYPNCPSQEHKGIPEGYSVVTIQGHEYIENNIGEVRKSSALVHSESCPNPIHSKQ